MIFASSSIYLKRQLEEFLAIVGDFDGKVLIFFPWLVMDLTFDLFKIVLSIGEDSSIVRSLLLCICIQEQVIFPAGPCCKKPQTCVKSMLTMVTSICFHVPASCSNFAISSSTYDFVPAILIPIPS